MLVKKVFVIGRCRHLVPVQDGLNLDGKNLQHGKTVVTPKSKISLIFMSKVGIAQIQITQVLRIFFHMIGKNNNLVCRAILIALKG